jgi:hypothetical protein
MEKSAQKSGIGFLGACAVLVVAEYLLFRDNFDQFFGPDAIFCMNLRFRSIGEFVTSLIQLDPAHWYRPLSNRTIPAIFFPIFGFRPYPYHWVMFALFAAFSLVVCFFLKRLTGSKATAFIGAFYFAIHSSNIYTTFDFAFAPDVLYGLFYVCAVWAFIEFNHNHAPRWQIASAGFFVLSLMSKEAAVTLPGVLLWYYWIFGKRSMVSAVSAVWPHLAVFGIYGLYIAAYLKVGGGDYMLTPNRITTNLKTALYFAFNLRRMDWIPFHGNAPKAVITFFVVLGVATLVLIGCLLFGRDRKPLLFGLGWFLLAATPVLMLNGGIGPYYLFLPMVGLSMAVGISLSRLASGPIGKAGIGAVLALLWICCRIVVVPDMLGDVALGQGARLALNSYEDVLQAYPRLAPGTNIYFYNKDVPDLWRHHGHGDLFKLAYDDPTITSAYRSLGETPPKEGRLVVFKTAGDRLQDVTEEFRRRPEEFQEEVVEPEYEVDSKFALSADPAEVLAGRDFYWLSIPGLKDEYVTIQYSLDGGPPAELHVQLNPKGKVRFFVSGITPLGDYHFLRFRFGSMTKWIKADARLKVLKSE